METLEKEAQLNQIRQQLLESDWPIGSRGYNYLRLPDELRQLNLSTLGREVGSRFELLRVPEDLSGFRVLDICCNIGSIGIEALRRGAEFVWGVDVNDKALNIGRNVASYLNYSSIDFRCMDLHKAEAQNQLLALDYDVLFCFSAVLHIPEPFVIELMKRAGVVYFEGHDEVSFEYYHEHLFRYLGPEYELQCVSYSFDFGKRLIARIERRNRSETYASLGFDSVEIDAELYGGTTSRVFRTKKNSVIKKYFRKTPGHNPEFFQNQYKNEVYWLRELHNEKFTPRLLAIDEDTLTFECSYVGEPICKAHVVPLDWKEQLREILVRLNYRNCFHRDLHADQVMTDGKKVYLIDFSYSCRTDDRLPLPKRVVFHDSPIVNQIEYFLSCRNGGVSGRLESCIIRGSDSEQIIDYLSKYYSVIVGIDYHSSAFEVIAPQYRRLIEPLFKNSRSSGDHVFTFVALFSRKCDHANTVLENVREPFRLSKCLDLMPMKYDKSRVQCFSRRIENRTIFQALSCYSLGFPGCLWDLYETKVLNH